MNQIASNSCLVEFRSRIWGASSVVDLNEYGFEVPNEIVKSVGRLLAEENSTLKAVDSIRKSAKYIIQKNTIDTSIIGFRMAPKSMIKHIDTQLQAYKKVFYEEVGKFMDSFEAEKLKFKEKYPEFYSESRYPTSNYVRSRFVFDWFFRAFDVPDKDILSAVIYDNEIKKFQEEMVKMREIAIDQIGKKFMSRVQSLHKHCSETGDVIHQNTINSITSFFEEFEEKWDGLIGYEEMRKLIDRCKDIIGTADSESIRADDSFRTKIAEGMKSVMEEFEKTIVNRNERSLDI